MAWFRIPLLSLLLITASTAQEAGADRKAVEVTPRNGLPNALSKLTIGGPFRIAYLGGSITAAPGWRVLSREWLQETYPQAAIEEIHAAIGGTGSDLGVFRLEQDVLRHRPDLLFVEFAVNDGTAPPEQIHRAMEGIVRQTWRANPSTSIVFVYTLSEPMLDMIQEGRLPQSAASMEDIADHYGIPSIHLGVEIARLEAAGELTFQGEKPGPGSDVKPIVFSTDGVHPLVETGHRLYVEAIQRAWPRIRDASAARPSPHHLADPFRADNWEEARLIPIAPGMLRGNWQPLPPDHTLSERFGSRLPGIFQATSPGATMAFSFTGTFAAIFDLLGPDGGQLQIQLDDAPPQLRNRIDGYSTYPRLSTLKILNETEPAPHTIAVSLTGTEVDKRDILFEKNRIDFDTNPEKYAPLTWHAGALLLIGDLHTANPAPTPTPTP